MTVNTDLGRVPERKAPAPSLGQQPAHPEGSVSAPMISILECPTQSGYLTRLSGKEATCQCRRRGFSFRVGKIPWRRQWQPTPGKSHGYRGLSSHSLGRRRVGCHLVTEQQQRRGQPVSGGTGRGQPGNNHEQQPRHTFDTFLPSKLFLIPSTTHNHPGLLRGRKLRPLYRCGS